MKKIAILFAGALMLAALSCKREAKQLPVEPAASQPALEIVECDPELRETIQAIEADLQALEERYERIMRNCPGNVGTVLYEYTRREADEMKALVRRDSIFSEPWAEAYVPKAAAFLKKALLQEVDGYRKLSEREDDPGLKAAGNHLRQKFMIRYAVALVPIAYSRQELKGLEDEVERSVRELYRITWDGLDSAEVGYVAQFLDMVPIRERELAAGNLYRSSLFEGNEFWER